MERKIIDYTIVNKTSADKLKEKVKTINGFDGLATTGGLAVTFAPNQKPVFAQTLVLYSK